MAEHLILDTYTAFVTNDIECVAMANDGTYIYAGMDNGEIWRYTISGATAALFATVPYGILAMTLYNNVLYVSLKDGSIVYFSGAASFPSSSSCSSSSSSKSSSSSSFSSSSSSRSSSSLSSSSSSQSSSSSSSESSSSYSAGEG